MNTLVGSPLHRTRGIPRIRRLAAFAGLVSLVLTTTIATVRSQESLLRDINRSPLGTASSSPDEMVSLLGRVICTTHSMGMFSVDAAGSSTRLLDPSTPAAELTRVGRYVCFASGSNLGWTDGSRRGTVTYGLRAHRLSNLTAAGTRLFFVMQPTRGPDAYLFSWDSVSHVIWRSSQTVEAPRALTVVGDTLFFTAETSATGRELWSWDGNSMGLTLVREFSPGPDSTVFGPMAAKTRPSPWVPYLILDVQPFGAQRQLWVAQTTWANPVAAFATHAIYDEPGTNRFFLACEDSRASLGIELYSSEGTPTTNNLVADIAAGPAHSHPRFFGWLSGRLLFSADDPGHGRELWSTDGTANGTGLVRDIQAGTGSSLVMGMPGAILDVGGSDRLLFAANDGASGLEPWISDGSSGGTRLLRDTYPGSTGGGADEFVGLSGSQAAFVAVDRLLGSEPWITDGTRAGTRVLVDLRTTPGGPVTADSDPAHGVRYGPHVLFAADDGQHGVELWQTAGATMTTQLRADLVPGPAGSSPRDFTIVGDMLFFTADDPGGVRRLWVQRGSSSPPAVVSAATRDPTELCAVGDVLFFQNQDAATGGELWKSDGTLTGTVLVRDLVQGAGSSDPNAIVAFRHRAYFVATHPLVGTELWASDGTAAGTRFVSDIVQGSVSSTPRELTVVGDTLFFTATSSGYGRELWKSSGTTGTTAIVADIRAGLRGSDPTALTRVRERLFFMADDGARGREVWVSDGTAAGTNIVRDVWPGTTRGALGSLLAGGGLLYFQGMDASGGPEPWRSDGTQAGTFALGDLQPGVGGSYPEFQAASGSRFMWFSARTADAGRELWRSDGTVAGTVRITDTRPGSDSSDPVALGVFRNQLVFAAVDPEKGREPFVLDVGATTVPYGYGCSFDRRVPALYVDDLVLGRVAVIEMYRVRPGSVALLGLSARQLGQPIRLDPGCWLYPDGGTVALWGPYAAPGGTLRMPLAVPNAAVLQGWELVWQGLSVPSPSPLGFDMSAGVVTTCGS